MAVRELMVPLLRGLRSAADDLRTEAAHINLSDRPVSQSQPTAPQGMEPGAGTCCAAIRSAPAGALVTVARVWQLLLRPGSEQRGQCPCRAALERVAAVGQRDRNCGRRGGDGQYA